MKIQIANRSQGTTKEPLRAPKTNWLATFASALSSGVAIVCPVCIPAVGAFLVSIGLGVAVNLTVLRSVLIVLLLASIGSLTWSATKHGRWWVVGSGLFGAALVYAGRYLWFNEILMWLGAAILIGTSLINFKIKRSCALCQSTEAGSISR